MKPFFRWRTEEDEFQDGGDLQETAVPSHNSRRLIVAFIGLLIAGAAFIYWQQIGQVQLEEKQIQEDVLASHRTWEKAASQADFDLFVHLLSHQDSAWQNAQRQLFLQGVILDRAPLGLIAQAKSGETAVTLSPDWQAAEVTFEQIYTAVTNTETAAIIQLQHTRLYQLDGSRWLQTSPDASFWGETLTHEGKWLTLLYPARDADWAERLASDLDDELTDICDVHNCTTGVNVRLETAPASLAALRDLLTPAFNGRFHSLPTFTLVGRPLDEAGYRALYQGYTRRILIAFQNSLNLPVPLPDQAIQTICFPDGGDTPRLFRYDLAGDNWTAELPDRAFRFLTPLPNDSGVILIELPAGSEASRLRLSLWQAGQETLLFDDANRAWRFPPIGWGGPAQQPHFLLHEFDAVTQTRTLYGWLDWDRCRESGCAATDLPGYTVWSPDGRYTLIVTGSEITLGDGEGRPLQTIGSGSNPFWLDETSYGYMRYAPQVELVAAALDDESPRVLLPVEALTAVLNDPETGVPYINAIAVSPASPRLLFLTSPEIRGASGKYNIFSFQVMENWRQNRDKIPAGVLTLRLQLDESPLGYPSSLTPGGIPPITFSPDGNYLVAAQRTGPPTDIWNIHLHDIAVNQTQTIPVGSPRYPANTPFFDWSKDSQWLVIVDDGFFKLVAPAANYERLILHDFDACTFTAWVNR